MKAHLLARLGGKQLLRAAERGQTPRLRTLIGRGADPSVADASGRTALHYATAHGHAEAVRTLLHYGADPNIRDKALGYTPLNLAVRDGQAEIAALLLEHGADVRGLHDRLLERAMRNQDTPISLLLRQHGARMAHEPTEADEPKPRGPLPASRSAAPAPPPQTPSSEADHHAHRDAKPDPAKQPASHEAAPVSPPPPREPSNAGAPETGASAAAPATGRAAETRNTEPRRTASTDETAAGQTAEHVPEEPTDPELAAVIRAWPTLSQPMRTAILTMIQATPTDTATPDPPAPLRPTASTE